MYSYEKRKETVELYLNYQSYSAVITKLGYPFLGMLCQWLYEINNNEDLHRTQNRKPKYDEEQKKKAVDYYIGNSRCISKTNITLGYLSRHYLKIGSQHAFLILIALADLVQCW